MTAVIRPTRRQVATIRAVLESPAMLPNTEALLRQLGLIANGLARAREDSQDQTVPGARRLAALQAEARAASLAIDELRSDLLGERPGLTT